MCVFFALNAAAYTPPLFGPNGYLKNKWKMARFYLIPLCVSSISVACGASHDECRLLFPRDGGLLAALILVMLSILIFGSLIHYKVLPKCPCHVNNSMLVSVVDNDKTEHTETTEMQTI